MADTNGQFHVTLRSPVGIRKPTGEIAWMRSFDATSDPGERPAFLNIEVAYVFRVNRIWPISPKTKPAGTKGVSYKHLLIIPHDNIAGLVPLPFLER
jgi:hypothetical protein